MVDDAPCARCGRPLLANEWTREQGICHSCWAQELSALASAEVSPALNPLTVDTEQICSELADVISTGRGIVALEVRRPGGRAVRARISPSAWPTLLRTLERVEQEQEDSHEEA
jgi:hypothetical protein